MEETIELLFGNRFFQLPFLEAMSYIAAALLIGAIFVGLTRRLMGSSGATCREHGASSTLV